ncbi:MAG: NAD(P)-dependent oxidoreductase [Saprospiraceae bacterium]|nr:NAD(P)-dependent oxidoreductase [Saprospiraceae bacterium]
MKIGIIREGKVPPDARVPLTPAQCRHLLDHFPLELVVQPSPIRCFSDTEYLEAGIPMSADVSDCDVLLGVKEVPIANLIPGKTYLFFSHTIKKQPANKKLLQEIIRRNIRIIDYELLTDDLGRRVIAFGKFAGMVGAHNALYTYGEQSGLFHLKRMFTYREYADVKQDYRSLVLPAVKIVLSGTGRVAQGAAQVLLDMGIKQVDPEAFLHQTWEEAVFTQLSNRHYVARKGGKPFEGKDFYAHPEDFCNAFLPYASVADILIHGIFWDTKAPAFFTLEDMRAPDFRIRVIGDITCDLAPETSIPATIKASTIQDPVFGFDPQTGEEVPAYTPGAIDMMTIDNLPSELPRDASIAFGEQFIRFIILELLKASSPMISRATIAAEGDLCARFEYLRDYVTE